MCHDLPVTGLGFAPKSTAKKAGTFQDVVVFHLTKSIIHYYHNVTCFFVWRRMMYVHRHPRIACFMLCRQQASIHQNRRRYVPYHNIHSHTLKISLLTCTLPSLGSGSIGLSACAKFTFIVLSIVCMTSLLVFSLFFFALESNPHRLNKDTEL